MLIIRCNTMFLRSNAAGELTEDSRFFLIGEQILLGRRGVYYATNDACSIVRRLAYIVLAYPRERNTRMKKEIRGLEFK